MHLSQANSQIATLRGILSARFQSVDQHRDRVLSLIGFDQFHDQIDFVIERVGFRECLPIEFDSFVVVLDFIERASERQRQSAGVGVNTQCLAQRLDG